MSAAGRGLYRLTDTMKTALVKAARGPERGNLAQAGCTRQTREALVARGLVEAWQAAWSIKPYVEARLTAEGWRAVAQLDPKVDVPPRGERWAAYRDPAVSDTLPVPAKRDDRTCFGIAYFTTEAQAQAYAAWVDHEGRTYNGGFFHGMACGRDRAWDHHDATLGDLYAVTD